MAQDQVANAQVVKSPYFTNSLGILMDLVLGCFEPFTHEYANEGLWLTRVWPKHIDQPQPHVAGCKGTNADCQGIAQ